MPMKDRPAAESIIEEIIMVASTMMGLMALGSTCFKTILKGLEPDTRAAWM